MKKIKESTYDRIYNYEAGDAGHTVVIVDTADEGGFEILRKRLDGLTIVNAFESYSGTPCLYLTDGEDVFILENLNFKGKEKHTELRILVDDNNIFDDEEGV